MICIFIHAGNTTTIFDKKRKKTIKIYDLLAEFLSSRIYPNNLLYAKKYEYFRKIFPQNPYHGNVEQEEFSDKLEDWFPEIVKENEVMIITAKMSGLESNHKVGVDGNSIVFESEDNWR